MQSESNQKLKMCVINERETAMEEEKLGKREVESKVKMK